jgi:hypothetical protein
MDENTFRRHEENQNGDTILLTEVTKMTELYSIRGCGKAIGIAPHQIAYAHTQERLAEPQFRVAGKRIYTADDVQRVAAYFAEKRRKKEAKNGD